VKTATKRVLTADTALRRAAEAYANELWSYKHNASVTTMRSAEAAADVLRHAAVAFARAPGAADAKAAIAPAATKSIKAVK
jgi:hypothetical protein